MRTKLLASLTVLIVGATSAIWGQGQSGQSGQQSAPPQGQSQQGGGGRVVFRGGVNLILVDVTVRDGKGNPVEGLTQNDFEVIENGKSQEIVNFKYEKVAANSTSTIMTAATLSRAGDGKGAVPVVLGLTGKGTTAAKVTPPNASPTPIAPASGSPATPDKSAETAPKQPVDAGTGPLTSDEVAGHRVWVLLFDTSSMQPEDVQKAADAAIKWTQEKMSASDIVALSVISSSLQIVQDFTNDKAKILARLKAFAVADGTAPADVDASTMASDETTNSATGDTTTTDASAQELATFNVDMRLRALKTLCDGMVQIQQHKAILYFSAGMTQSQDNAVELRSAENACSRSNTSINPVDSRGLQVVVAGGNARTGGRGGGVSAYNGSGVRGQFTQLQSSQESLQTLAADTGGTAFTDSNDFGEAFDKVEKDISAYYMIGYASSNNKQDGSYRKIEVKLKTKVDGVKVKAREGYYAPTDFSNMKKTDRETQMQEQLLMAIPATDVPLFVASGYFRLPDAQVDKCGNQFGMGGPGGGPPGGGAGGPGGGRGGGGQGGPGGPGGGRGGFQASCYYVPISVTIPGESIPVSETNEMLDVRGMVRDERGQQFATIKQTITVPPAQKGSIGQKQILFQTGAMLPPGRYTAKILVRENTTGQMGTYEANITVPDFNRSQQMKVSTVVMSTQLLAVPPGLKNSSPLVHDNIEIVPNLTHVVHQDQKLYFYYEVYDPTLSDGTQVCAAPAGANAAAAAAAMANCAPQVRTSLAFYRKGTKIYETPLVERTNIDAPEKKAQIYEFEVDGSKFKPGVYTCQVNVFDEVAGKFGFQRFDVAVMPSDKAGGTQK